MQSREIREGKLTYEPIPERRPEHELAALLKQLAQHQSLATID